MHPTVKLMVNPIHNRSEHGIERLDRDGLDVVRRVSLLNMHRTCRTKTEAIPTNSSHTDVGVMPIAAYLDI
jgi:hypothetical protein